MPPSSSSLSPPRLRYNTGTSNNDANSNGNSNRKSNRGRRSNMGKKSNNNLHKNNHENVSGTTEGIKRSKLSFYVFIVFPAALAYSYSVTVLFYYWSNMNRTCGGPVKDHVLDDEQQKEQMAIVVHDCALDENTRRDRRSIVLGGGGGGGGRRRLLPSILSGHWHTFELYNRNSDYEEKVLQNDDYVIETAQKQREAIVGDSTYDDSRGNEGADVIVPDDDVGKDWWCRTSSVVESFMPNALVVMLRTHVKRKPDTVKTTTRRGAGERMGKGKGKNKGVASIDVGSSSSSIPAYPILPENTKSSTGGSLSGSSKRDSKEFSRETVAHRALHAKSHEELSKMHPMQRAVHAAASFFIKKKAKKEELKKMEDSKVTKAVVTSVSSSATWEISEMQMGLIEKLRASVLDQAAERARALGSKSEENGKDAAITPEVDFDKRVGAVPWGGPGLWRDHETDNLQHRQWWSPPANANVGNGDATSKFEDGTFLLYGYLRIMQWPLDLRTHFPFKLCSTTADDVGCDAAFAIFHTVEWREKYRPWIVTPAMKWEASSYGAADAALDSRVQKAQIYSGRGGWLWNRGFAIDGHSLIWYRPGYHRTKDPEDYIRVLLFTLESAIADSLLHSKGKIGKYHVVMDCEGFGFKSIPDLRHVKRAFTFLQDHFPNRLGSLFIGNLGRAADLFLKMVRPLLTEAVKKKIQIIPSTTIERDNMLREFIDIQSLPTWLGGQDDYIFNTTEYFGRRDESDMATNEDGREYLVTMPYHA